MKESLSLISYKEEATTQLIITASQLILHTKVFFDAQGAPWGVGGSYSASTWVRERSHAEFHMVPHMYGNGASAIHP